MLVSNSAAQVTISDCLRDSQGKVFLIVGVVALSLNAAVDELFEPCTALNLAIKSADGWDRGGSR